MALRPSHAYAGPPFGRRRPTPAIELGLLPAAVGRSARGAVPPRSYLIIQFYLSWVPCAVLGLGSSAFRPLPPLYSPSVVSLVWLFPPARVYGASAASDAWSEYARAGSSSHARVGQCCVAPPAKTGVAFAGTCCAPLACCLFLSSSSRRFVRFTFRLISRLV